MTLHGQLCWCHLSFRESPRSRLLGAGTFQPPGCSAPDQLCLVDPTHPSAELPGLVLLRPQGDQRLSSGTVVHATSCVQAWALRDSAGHGKGQGSCYPWLLVLPMPFLGGQDSGWLGLWVSHCPGHAGGPQDPKVLSADILGWYPQLPSLGGPPGPPVLGAKVLKEQLAGTKTQGLAWTQPSQMAVAEKGSGTCGARTQRPQHIGSTAQWLLVLSLAVVTPAGSPVQGSQLGTHPCQMPS